MAINQQANRMNVDDLKIGVPVRRILNVESATNQLEGAVSDILEAVEALEAHLQPLLSPERPCNIGEDRKQGESEVADRIISSADRVGSASARIRELIDRL